MAHMVPSGTASVPRWSSVNSKASKTWLRRSSWAKAAPQASDEGPKCMVKTIEKLQVPRCCKMFQDVSMRYFICSYLFQDVVYDVFWMLSPNSGEMCALGEELTSDFRWCYVTVTSLSISHGQSTTFIGFHIFPCVSHIFPTHPK